MDWQCSSFYDTPQVGVLIESIVGKFVEALPLSDSQKKDFAKKCRLDTNNPDLLKFFQHLSNAYSQLTDQMDFLRNELKLDYENEIKKIVDNSSKELSFMSEKCKILSAKNKNAQKRILSLEASLDKANESKQKLEEKFERESAKWDRWLSEKNVESSEHQKRAKRITELENEVDRLKKIHQPKKFVSINKGVQTESQPTVPLSHESGSHVSGDKNLDESSLREEHCLLKVQLRSTCKELERKNTVLDFYRNDNRDLKASVDALEKKLKEASDKHEQALVKAQQFKTDLNHNQLILDEKNNEIMVCLHVLQSLFVDSSFIVFRTQNLNCLVDQANQNVDVKVQVNTEILCNSQFQITFGQ